MFKPIANFQPEVDNGLVIKINPEEYIDFLIRSIKKNKKINVFDNDLLFLDKLILKEYLSRTKNQSFKEVLILIRSEKKLINLVIKHVLRKRLELIDSDVEFLKKKLKINLGMVLSLTNSKNITTKDYLYAAFYEKFVHGTSTSFGFLREAEVFDIKKKPNHFIFPFKTDSKVFSQQSSFDLILIITDIQKENIKELIFIQSTSGPNSKNFTHAIQITNVKNWFQRENHTLKDLKNYINEKHVSKFESLLIQLKSVEIDDNIVKTIIGQAYGDKGMTQGMMNRTGVEVVRGPKYWELITGIKGVNPFYAEKIAGIIVLSIKKRGESSKTQKLNFWKLIDWKLNEISKEFDLIDYSFT